MPNRILRDWTDSESIDRLSVNAERFFTRLIMKVDDYGRYTANVKMLKSMLFPLKTDVRETDIALWLTECEQCGVIALYNIAMRDYLQIENFNQQLRQKNEKYPAPPSTNEPQAGATQMHSTCIADVNGALMPEISQLPKITKDKIQVPEKQSKSPPVNKSLTNAAQMHSRRQSSASLKRNEVETEEEEKKVEKEKAASPPTTIFLNERHSAIYEMFQRVSQWKADKMQYEVSRFMNKYPLVPIQKCGGLVNTWVANEGNSATQNKISANTYI